MSFLQFWRRARSKRQLSDIDIDRAVKESGNFSACNEPDKRLDAQIGKTFPSERECKLKTDIAKLPSLFVAPQFMFHCANDEKRILALYYRRKQKAVRGLHKVGSHTRRLMVNTNDAGTDHHGSKSAAWF